MRIFGIAIFLCITLLATGCNENYKPKNLIAEDTYIDLLVEIQLAKSYQKSLSPDSVIYDSLSKEIFEKYGVTKERFQTSHDYYQKQLPGQTERLNEAIERLRKDMAKGDKVDTTATG